MTTPYAKALVSLNGGGLVGGGQTVTAMHTVQLQGENTSGWRKSRWEIIGPPGWAVPAGWTDEDGVAVYVGVTGNPPLWTLPAITAFGKWIVTLIVNDGEKDGDAAHVDMRDSTLALSMVSANGLEDIGTGEGTQFDDVRSWTGALQAMVRQVDTALGLISGTSETVTLTGTNAIGDVVCSANDAAAATKVALATAANLANGGAAGIRVMLEAGTVGQNKSAAGPGDIIAPSVLGLVAGATTDTVIINTTSGRAARVLDSAVLASDWVLGHCDKQGNTTIDPRAPGTVVAPVATRSAIASGNNRQVRLKSWIPDLQDFFDDYGGADNNSDDCAAALNTMIATCGGRLGTDAIIRPPLVGHVLRKPILISDDTAGGTVQNFVLCGAHAGLPNHGINVPHFTIDIPIPSGNAASITDLANGGSGHNTATITLGAGSSLVTVASKFDWVGVAWLELWNCATNANVGIWPIVNVPSDGVVRVDGSGLYGTGGGALTGTDANNNNLRWRIIRPTFQIRGRSNGMRGISMAPAIGNTIPVGILLGAPINTGGIATIFRNFVERCGVLTSDATARPLDDGVWVKPNDVFIGTGATQNGRGDYKAVDLGQGESWRVENTSFGYCRRANVRVFSQGQAKTGMIHNLELFAHTGMSFEGPGSADITACKGYVDDAAIAMASTGSNARNVEKLYIEGPGALFDDNPGQLPCATRLVSLSANNPDCHPSGETVRLRGMGPYEIHGGRHVYGAATAGNSTAHLAVTCGNNPARGITIVSCRGLDLAYVPTCTSARARVNSVNGPFCFAGTEILPVVFNSSGLTRTISFTQRNFNNAVWAELINSVDLNRTTPFQVGRLLDGGLRRPSTAYDVGAVVRPNVANGRTYILASLLATATGTTPPTITLTGAPLGAFTWRIECTGAGALGVWTGRWSSDNGGNWNAFTSGATVALGSTGMTANIAAGNAATNNVWTFAQTTSATASATATSGWSTVVGTSITDGNVTWTCCEGWRGWGDMFQAWLMTQTDSSPGRVAITAGSTANAILGFSTVLQSGLIPTQMCTDVLGYILPTYSSYSTCNVRLATQGCAGHVSGGNATKIPELEKDYYANPNVGGRYVSGVRGVSGYDSTGNNGGVDSENFNGVANIVDANVVAPLTVTSSGTTPPVITLTGTPAASYFFVIKCTTLGARGTWVLKWSSDGGATYTTGVLSAATVVLGATGITANIAVGTAAVNNTWDALSTLYWAPVTLPRTEPNASYYVDTTLFHEGFAATTRAFPLSDAESISRTTTGFRVALDATPGAGATAKIKWTVTR